MKESHHVNEYACKLNYKTFDSLRKIITQFEGSKTQLENIQLTVGDSVGDFRNGNHVYDI